MNLQFFSSLEKMLWASEPQNAVKKITSRTILGRTVQEIIAGLLFVGETVFDANDFFSRCVNIYICVNNDIGISMII